MYNHHTITQTKIYHLLEAVHLWKAVLQMMTNPFLMADLLLGFN